MSAETLPALLKRHGIFLKKGLGQHFLTDANIAANIARAARPHPEERVVEIGPGAGSLTLPLLREAGRVWAIERDGRLGPLLRERCQGAGTLHLLEEDALRVDFTALAHQAGGPLVVAANLPYNISTPILFHLLEHRGAIRRLVLMFQREVAQRIAAAPGGREYGALSVQCQLWCRIALLFPVPPGAFLPPPKVDSAVVRMMVREEPAVPLDDPARFSRVVHAAFAQRRKTLANALKALDPRGGEWPQRAGIDPRRRGETLSLEEFARLSAVAEPSSPPVDVLEADDVVLPQVGSGLDLDDLQG